MGGQYIDAVPPPAPLARLIESLPKALAARLPSQCALCLGWGGERMCPACIARFTAPGPRCARCAIRVPPGVPSCGRCLTDTPPFDASVAAVDYAHPWDGLIARFKFHGALDLAPVFVALLAEACARRADEWPDLLLPVPLSRERLAQRGYNQAWELARRLGRRVGCAADPHLLLRIKDTAHQLGAPLKRRAVNVRGAFAVEPLRRAELQGRRVALIDDVMTSGATAAEAARVLRAAGAASVQVWTVARTPAPD
jgi:ComF family protein